MSLLSKPYIYRKQINKINTAQVYTSHRQHNISSPAEKRNPGWPRSVRRYTSPEWERRAAKVRALGKQLGTAGSAWPPSQTRSTGTAAPTMACALPAPLLGRQLEG
jgi:hypothetical protein